eukprot:gnl/Ergobibamus_cyprinoides/563.p1 GENE.gnl/Ergobibamus_cyprinoides/563~~gnl/Ergobibamus_cyprinoides/563.p1  ORF type:complete len:271 (+),score=64.64 gnl/Ergobibamus_cyprinoides/563:429-1241(+)
MASCPSAAEYHLDRESMTYVSFTAAWLDSADSSTAATTSPAAGATLLAGGSPISSIAPAGPDGIISGFVPTKFVVPIDPDNDLPIGNNGAYLSLYVPGKSEVRPLVDLPATDDVIGLLRAYEAGFGTGAGEIGGAYVSLASVTALTGIADFTGYTFGLDMPWLAAYEAADATPVVDCQTDPEATVVFCSVARGAWSADQQLALGPTPARVGRAVLSLTDADGSRTEYPYLVPVSSLVASACDPADPFSCTYATFPSGFGILEQILRDDLP